MSQIAEKQAETEPSLSDRMASFTSVAELVRNVMVSSTKLSREHMEQAARKYLVSYLTADIEGRAALFADDAIFEDPVGAEPIRGLPAIVKFWEGARAIRWWAAHDVRRVVVSGNEVMLHFVSTMRVPGLKQAAMEVFEQQVFNDAGKIAHVRVYFDSDCLISQ
jgi:steroid delta-isomerase